MHDTSFNYYEAFSRNIGLLTQKEQEVLRKKTIAIAGMGGVGGVHLISLVRQGFEHFKIADLDIFEEKNMNRQYGARMDTLGQSKVEVMREEAHKINPECTIEVFEEGVTVDNIDTFLAQADLLVDSLDAFAIDARRMSIMKAHTLNIPVISAGPIGFGTAFFIFMPNSPSFDEYFAIHDGMTEKDMTVRFFIGLIPKLLQRSYMKNTNLDEKRGPSSIGAVNLCAGVVTVNAVKILLNKGTVHAVPYYHQFDLMHDRYVRGKLRFGNRGPIQRLKILLFPLLEKKQR
ncbi:ThiF family adenylyltransferase [Candidatus Kaiserbacteria bacterium]|nr:MAG: ThiF family adenylyltransferase [Candidatus Kaiserbacteria bacterium]